MQRTVSAHLFDGTVLDIAEIATEYEYRSLLVRLANAEPPAPLTFWEKLSRSVNKSLGRPATADVGVLARHVAQLRDAAQSRLPGEDVGSVAVSLTPVRGLRIQDLEDALAHAGVKSWMQSDDVQAGLYPAALTEPHAVYAAHGRGLCRDYKDLFECWEEEEQFTEETLLVARLTPTALTVEVATLKAPFEWYQALVDYIIEPRAGLESLPAFDSPEAFWEYVQTVLDTFVARLRGALPTSIVLLSADATRPEFVRALRRALARSHDAGIVGTLMDAAYDKAVWGQAAPDAFSRQFGPSRGAAQYARWRREAPMGCVEEKRCEDERKKERSGVALEPSVAGADSQKSELK